MHAKVGCSDVCPYIVLARGVLLERRIDTVAVFVDGGSSTTVYQYVSPVVPLTYVVRLDVQVDDGVAVESHHFLKDVRADTDGQTKAIVVRVALFVQLDNIRADVLVHVDPATRIKRKDAHFGFVATTTALGLVPRAKPHDVTVHSRDIGASFRRVDRGVHALHNALDDFMPVGASIGGVQFCG